MAYCSLKHPSSFAYPRCNLRMMAPKVPSTKMGRTLVPSSSRMQYRIHPYSVQAATTSTVLHRVARTFSRCPLPRGALPILQALQSVELVMLMC